MAEAAPAAASLQNFDLSTQDVLGELIDGCQSLCLFATMGHSEWLSAVFELKNDVVTDDSVLRFDWHQFDIFNLRQSCRLGVPPPTDLRVL